MFNRTVHLGEILKDELIELGVAPIPEGMRRDVGFWIPAG